MLKYWAYKDDQHIYFMLAPQWIKFNPGAVYSSVLKQQQENILKNHREQVKRSNQELGIDDASEDPLSVQLSNPADQANLFRIEQLLTRNSNFIKEP